MTFYILSGLVIVGLIIFGAFSSGNKCQELDSATIIQLLKTKKGE